jgi:hypothetical protein
MEIARSLLSSCCVMLVFAPCTGANAPRLKLDPPRIEVSIKPDKADWVEGESISGSITLYNPTDREIRSLSIGHLTPIVKTVGGHDAQRFAARAYLCGNVLNRPDVTIPAKGQVSEPFRIDTDPLGEIGGFRMPPGRYTVAFRSADIGGDHASPTPARVSVKPNPEFQIGHRIRFIGIAADRLVALRENGEAQSFSEVDGRMLAHADLGDITPSLPALDYAEVSPDGQWIGRVITSRKDRDGFAVQLTQMTDRPEIRSYPIEQGPSDTRVPWLRGFDVMGNVVWLASTEGIHEVRLVDGKALLLSVWPKYSQVSPDGQFGIHLGATIHTRDGADIGGDWPGTDARRLMGIRGVYGSAQGTSGNWRSYDGATRRTFADVGDVPIAESADGTLVACGVESSYSAARGSGRIDIFSTDDQNRLWEIADGKCHTVGFSSHGTDLVSATIMHGDSSTFWIADSFDIRDARTGTLKRTFTLRSAQPTK